MKKFLVLFEKSATGYGAYAPDLPGCVATGRTLEETKMRMAKAMEMHLSAMREENSRAVALRTSGSGVTFPTPRVRVARPFPSQ